MLGYPGRVGKLAGGGAILRAPSLDISFLSTTLDPRFTFGRTSIATDGLFTDAAGSGYNSFATGVPRISTTRGLLLEGSTLGRLLNTDAPATQTTGSCPVSTYTLTVIGTGSAIASAGTATISGQAAATNGTPNVFSVSVAGTVTVTVTPPLTRFQLESNAYPTSYIPCAGVTVTRQADTATMPIGSWFNQAAGTLWAEAMLPAEFSSSPVFICFDDTTTSNRIQFNINTAGNGSIVVVNAGVSGQRQTTNAMTFGTIFRAAATYSASGMVAALSGSVSARTALPTGGVPTITTMRLGALSSGTGSLNGFLRRIRYYPRELSSAELTAITT